MKFDVPCPNGEFSVLGMWRHHWPFTSHLVYVVCCSIFPIHSPLDTSLKFIELDQTFWFFLVVWDCMSIYKVYAWHHLSYSKVYLYTVLFEGLNFQPANSSMAPILGAETAAADHQNTRVEVKVLWNCHSCHTSWRVRAQNRDFGK